jgi:hypothetical protein
LTVSGNVGSILIEWGASVDVPSCSGIFEYVVSRDDVEIGRVGGDVLSFVDSDSLGDGEYSYYVHAVDMVGRNAGLSVVNTIKTSNGGSSGGSSSNSYFCDVDWECGTWGDCVDGERVRVCEDLNGCQTSYLKPALIGSCVDDEVSGGSFFQESVEEEEVGSEDGFFSVMTGAVVGVGETTEGKVGGAVILAVLLSFAAIRIRGRR